ncbi:MAG: adenylate/guanylate cyclase domain-containing protein [Rhodospirillales bacterium]|nr:adenylate/guanylate cyclase domain-containing protein [Rhodospirillales bacterium]
MSRPIAAPQRRKTALLAALSVAIALALAAVVWREAPLVAAADGETLDWRFRLRGELAPGPEVLLVAIDDRSVGAFGRWPIPREVLAAAVRALTRDGARVIAFDLLFADAQPAAPGADPDGELANAVREAKAALVPYAFVFNDDAGGAGAPPSVARSAYRIYRLPDRNRLATSVAPRGLIAPIPVIGEAAAGAGHVSVVLADDGSLRFDRSAIVYGDDLYPSLPIEAVRLFRGLSRDAVGVRLGDGISLAGDRLPIDAEMRLAVNYYGRRGTFQTVSLADVIAAHLPGPAATGRIVIIGATATGVGDSFVTPFSRTLPGPEHFATVIDNILHHRFLIRGERALAFDLLAIVAGALLAAAAASIRRPLIAMAAAAALLLGWAAVAQATFVFGRLWLNGVFPTLAIILTLSLVTAIRLVGEGRLRREAERERTNLARYVPAAFADLLAGADKPFGSDKVQQAAVMFVDMVGFTRIGEQLTPPEQLALLRAFHRRVEAVISAHGGTIDKFAGDGASASFGALGPQVEDAARALRCARALAADIAAWGASHADRAQAPRIGIGLHYGPVVVGEIGGERQQQFTVSGDTVNMASRLEALTRSHGVVIIASDALVECARAVGESDALAGFVPLPDQAIRGRTRPFAVWAWPAPANGEASEPSA